MSSQDEDIKEAIPFFRKAVQFEPKNFPAWMELISSLLQSHTENDEELEAIFNSIYNQSWFDKQMHSLKFLHGCFLFMKGQKDTAFDIWGSMYNLFLVCDYLIHMFNQISMNILLFNSNYQHSKDDIFGLTQQ